MSRTYSTPVASKSTAHENRTFCVDWKTENSDGEVRIVEGVAPKTFLQDYEIIGFPFGQPHTQNSVDGDSIE